MILRIEGANIQAWCTPCNNVIEHTIMIMKGNRISRVQCNTCSDEHVYRKQQPKRRKNAAKQEPSTAVIFASLMETANVEEAIAYTLSGSFSKDALLNHSKFGIGFVQRLCPGAKMEVIFETGIKTLVYNR